MKLPPSAAASGDELAARRPAQGKFDIAYGALLTQPGSTSARGWASPSRVKRETMVASKASWDIAVHRLPAHRHSCLRSGCCGQRLAPEAAHAARWPPSGSSVVDGCTCAARSGVRAASGAAQGRETAHVVLRGRDIGPRRAQPDTACVAHEKRV